MSQGPKLRGRAARLARLLPAGPSRAARTPFVLLMVLLLGGGLITLLMLNSSLNEGSFRLRELKLETTELTDEEQALQRDVDAHAAPDALQRRARELGMVPGGDPAFLDPDGTVRGVPGAASPTALSAPATPRPGLAAPPAPTTGSPSPSSAAPSPGASPTASPTPSAGPGGSPSAGTPGPSPSGSPSGTPSGAGATGTVSGADPRAAAPQNPPAAPAPTYLRQVTP
ncbi:septum formation initiator family protein [Streptomyces uncialis]|uniref:septum formation initiator family protein n=1 Tax=Streptomyces uncialis TaxID=1048205 RepID=UPI00386F5360|nr:septum formation initiator family protein [Streptomyces uncialis]